MIPKTNPPETFSHFRPISLCNVAYKTITKVLANKLKLVLPELIKEGQTSFIPGRHITENIIIAQEVIHSMSKKKKGKYMAIKIDLHKAYNRFR